ncbi:TBPIP-domain-containing protein [Pterulicium gracile]|uniref:TBPIP-domain-containing protein n=1 Tax=Pterulicium gracile TaxID=1884261 RepID=A0A5C3QRK0_9AGAR|nr:TBPIP-domain-containing protein [Pterula gracilis]
MTKETDVKVLKGTEAEDKVLEYMVKMNRPFGAVDVSANLKGAVTKITAQKALIALAEKGKLTQKIYGKTTFFVANQNTLEVVAPDKLSGLETECQQIDDANKAASAEMKTLQAELAKVRLTLTDVDLASRISETIKLRETSTAKLEPLRATSTLITEEELTQIDAEWVKWRAEWVRRRKVFKQVWDNIRDLLSADEASELSEELGIELDSSRHIALEAGPLCSPPLKRKRA